MNDVARLPTAERRVYFEQAAAQLGRLTPQLIEKDFWVCWLLHRVFALDEFGPHLTFKGGTSLSKVYQIIERFSEDVDLAVERCVLGFGGEHSPEQGQSGKEQKRRIKELRTVCQAFITTNLYPALHADIASALPQADWKLVLAEDDPDQQSIRFHFPASVVTGLNTYITPSVKLELGARSDHFPVESRTVQPYIAEAFPNRLREPTTTVRVLHVQRTFWEKATILHAYAHLPADKPLAKAQSRHYYDLYRLADHPSSAAAAHCIDMLQIVADHKSVFFKDPKAKYDEARPGTLRLVPDLARIDELRNDYRAMQPMFFGSVPKFDDIIARLTRLQDDINSQE